MNVMNDAQLNECLFECEIEDRGVAFLSDKPPRAAASIAVTAARLETQRWEIEKPEMLRRDDPRPVWKFSPKRLAFLELNTPPSGVSDIRAVAHLLSLFASLPADSAALVSIIVAEWAVDRAERSEL
jgi:hypothetical protein